MRARLCWCDANFLPRDFAFDGFEQPLLIFIMVSLRMKRFRGQLPDQPVGEPFFVAQGGVFHLVMAAAYLLAARDPARQRGLVDFSILVKLAALTGNGSWIDSAVRLYRSIGKPLPVETIDELHDVLRRVGAIDMVAFRTYAEELRARAPEMGPADRFLVGRIEGLARMAALR